ncbi:CLAVATA3/ESR-RELATED 9 [Perilla frutescens var. hirtella]|uniref:CLAVATA3/ESR-RELATED 9 n=1 Tax=Perilla frutescens var. hirtella TaxID=608512 RepID=A0AAD4NW89_PERFH|nr:CLAVATA3/ESR-RELATED 9 [Perilla frutescens var. hirtella]
MKNSPPPTTNSASSTVGSTCSIVIIIVIVLCSAANTECSSSTLQDKSAYADKILNHVGDSHPSYPSPHRLLLRRLRLCQTPPPPHGRKIDPRYDVEQRLVPGGPNPLHN